MNRLLVATSCAALAGAAATGAYIGVVTGRLTLDLGVGRRTRPLGPLHINIAAPRETVYAAAAAPYADRQPRAMRENQDRERTPRSWVVGASNRESSDVIDRARPESEQHTPAHAETSGRWPPQGVAQQQRGTRSRRTNAL